MKTKYVCKCKKCGYDKAEVDVNAIFASLPPKYRYVCPKCGERGYTNCSETDYIREEKEK